jgi:hypothetical protein
MRIGGWIERRCVPGLLLVTSACIAEPAVGTDPSMGISQEEITESSAEILQCGATSPNPHEVSGTCDGSATECKVTDGSDADVERLRAACSGTWGDSLVRPAKDSMATQCNRKCETAMQGDVSCDRDDRCAPSSCTATAGSALACEITAGSPSRVGGRDVDDDWLLWYCCTVTQPATFRARGRPTCTDCVEE